MPVYVDNARNRLGRMLTCHMVADSLEELHAMARAIGMKREWFQDKGFPHYDVSQTRRLLAVSLGAQEVGRRKLVEVMRRFKESEEWSTHLRNRDVAKSLASEASFSSSRTSTQNPSYGREQSGPRRSMLIKPPRPRTPRRD